MLIGLSAKNAILIVEFAVANYKRGMSVTESALEASRLRFRPIVMTALAFIVGCIPLWTASGAGSVSRRILGTVVIGGMALSTIVGVLMVPVTFSVVERLSLRLKRIIRDSNITNPDLDPTSLDLSDIEEDEPSKEVDA
jgi:HAE1 family hydrophobic/amphiphilic exporter-1